MTSRAFEIPATEEGFLPTVLPDVRLMHSKGKYPPSPVVYEPSVVIIAQGYKRARLGDSTFVYDSRNYLVLSVPLPFECETVGTSTKPPGWLSESIAIRSRI